MPLRIALLTSAAAAASWALSFSLLSALPSDLAVAVQHWFAPSISCIWDSLMLACFSYEQNTSMVANACYCGRFGYYYMGLYTAVYVPYAGRVASTPSLLPSCSSTVHRRTMSTSASSCDY
eukprot:6383506-Amphidinium_carterae.1